MLSLGPGSACDICLESYDQEVITPWSIPCGHIFCRKCLGGLDPKTCPFCRTVFESQEPIKLHIDLEGSSTAQVACATARQEARKFQDAIVDIANIGATEAGLRQLIAECRAFLNNHPRSLFQDLRCTVRLVTYLCDVRTNFQTQGAALKTLQAEATQLEAEKVKLEKRIRDLQEFRKYEKDTATQVENSLREHCSRAHEAYETMVDQYNFVTQEWMRLHEENRVLRMTLPSLPGPNIPYDLDLDGDSDSDSDIAKTPQPHPMAGLDQDKLKSAAVQKPETYLISPLPQFTGRLHDVPLMPDEDESFEDTLKLKSSSKAKQQETKAVYETMPSTPLPHRCDAAGHPYTCDCEGFEIFGEKDRLEPPPAAYTATPGFLKQAATPLYKSSQEFTPVVHTKAPPSTPNGSLYTVPMTPGRARSHTIPNHGSHPPSRASSRSSSPAPKSNSSASGRGISGSSSNHTKTRTSNNDNETLKSRLHDLLQDTSSVSSSLPNMPSSHFPASYTRATPQSPAQAALPSRPPDTSTSSLRHGVNSSPNFNDRRPSPQGSSGSNEASPPLLPASSIPPSFANSGATVSRASSAAAAIENERKKKKAEQKSSVKTNSSGQTYVISPAAIASLNYARSGAPREPTYTDSASNRHSHRPPSNSRTQDSSP